MHVSSLIRSEPGTSRSCNGALLATFHPTTQAFQCYFGEATRNTGRQRCADRKSAFPGHSMTKFTCLLSRTFAVSLLLLAGALTHAASVTGTVTNKTTSKPS